MRELANCPICKKSLKAKLIANFYFCKECEIAVRSEKNMPLSGINIYNRDWVKSQQSQRANFKRASKVLKQVRKLYGVKFVLDIGCGTGILVDTLNRNSYIADGIDSSSEAIRFAKMHKKGDFYLTSIDNFRSRCKYDLIIATQVIEHLRNPEGFLLKLKKILKTKGYLYIETPNLYSWSKKSIWRRRIGGMFYGLDHRILYTSKSLIYLLQENGFNTYKAFTRTFSPTIFEEIIRNVIFGSRKKMKTQKEETIPNLLNKKVEQNILKNVCKNIFKRVKYSWIVNALLVIPNRISEISGRGNQLIVIAKNRG